MANSFFKFKEFTIHQDRTAMKVTTDSCLFGAWVSQKLAYEKNSSRTLLDIGTGTGLLSLMIAQKTSLLVDAVEIDQNSFEQAKENIFSSKWQKRIQIFHQDIKIFTPARKYDFIICNPPFYENELTSPDNSKNKAHHSTELKLEDLLVIIRTLLKGSGSFFLLLPFKREKQIDDLFAKNNCEILEKILVRQSTNHSFFRLLLKGSVEKNIKTITSEIAIRNNDGDYTEEFVSLLKDFYLYL